MVVGSFTSILLSLSLAQTIVSQVQLINLTAEAAANLSTTCQGVIAQDVSCNSTITLLGAGELNGLWIYQTSMLAGLCSATCASALSTYLRRVAGACGSTYITWADGTQTLPALYAEQWKELYDQACLEDSSGHLCNEVVGSLAAINPMNQQITGTPVSTIECNSCFLSLMSTQLEQPLASNAGLSSVYSSLTSSCGVTSMSVAPLTATTTWGIPVTTTSTSATCSGTIYTIKPSDTCQSISIAEGISTTDLLVANNLQGYCYEFPTSGSLCIPSAKVCTPYTVKAGDTCGTIAGNLTAATSPIQIISWNPALGSSCSNLANLVGYVICVSNPGGTWVNPNPVTSSTTTSSTDTISWTPFSFFATASAAPNATAVVIPFANDTLNNCAWYLTPPVLTNNSANATSYACADAATQYGVSLADFLVQNPSLQGLDPCVLQPDEQYCARTYVEQSNATEYCIQYELAAPGYDCYLFAQMYGIDLEQFVAWNPDVGMGCANYTMGVEYCIDVSGFKQPGIISTCNKFVTPNDTAWLDDPCQIIETNYGLSHARFVAWNPAIESNCTGLYAGYEYCVSIPNYKPTYTTPATSIVTPTAPSFVSYEASSTSAS